MMTATYRLRHGCPGFWCTDLMYVCSATLCCLPYTELQLFEGPSVVQTQLYRSNTWWNVPQGDSKLTLAPEGDHGAPCHATTACYCGSGHWLQLLTSHGCVGWLTICDPPLLGYKAAVSDIARYVWCCFDCNLLLTDDDCICAWSLLLLLMP